jgi:hypothetical protein
MQRRRVREPSRLLPDALWLRAARARTQVVTYTYAILKVSPATWQEIHDKLVKLGYEDQITGPLEGSVLMVDGIIDMHGIALQEQP